MHSDIPEGLTYDDVLMIPQHSSILPGEADVRSRLTKDIPLNIPLVSSAMDTVTEDKLAIALAREGGIGVIHRNCTIEEQVAMIRKVKRSENIIIDNPQTIGPDVKLSELVSIMGSRGVSGFPVVDSEHHLLGIITRRDIGHRAIAREQD